MIKKMSVQELKEWRDKGHQFVLIDVREKWERDHCILQQDLHVPLKQVLKSPDAFDRNLPLVFYCHHGARSLAAATVVEGEGYTDLYNLEGGIDAWAKEIDPSVAKY